MSNAPASPAQIAFIAVLMGERELTDAQRADANDRFVGLTKSDASDLIGLLKGRPKAVAQTVLAVDVTPRDRVSEEGFYKAADGGVFKVVRSQIGRLYAKEATPGGLMYREGAMALLFADAKMTGEEIAAHGVANCFCVNCSTPLEDPTSKRIGLGTSCGPAILGKDGYKAARASVAHFADVMAFEAAKKADAKAKRDAKKAAAAQLELA